MTKFFLFTSVTLAVSASLACTTKSWTIRGSSLRPAVSSGSEVVGVELPCDTSVERGDLLIFHHSGSVNPVIKIVKGVPGDSFAFKTKGDASVLTVNGRSVVNSAGKEYRFVGARRSMLEIYMKDYNGRIPLQSFLVLGDNQSATLDSSTFGLVALVDAVGLVKGGKETLRSEASRGSSTRASKSH